MTNYEWLNALSVEKKAEWIEWLDDTTTCEVCAYHIDEEKFCKPLQLCKEGIIEWLNAKHIEPMPEIKIGDVVFVRIGGHFEKLVVMSDVYASNLHNMMVRWRELDDIKKIERMNDEKEMMECIWRADNE